MDQIPLANASAKLTARGTAPTAATLTTMWRPSTNAAPAITGIARRKLNSAAAAGPRPPHRAAHTVDPEREAPRNTAATACANPIPTATPTRRSGPMPLTRRVDQLLDPGPRDTLPHRTH